MAKIKVHELAKELGVNNKTVVSYLRDKGYDSMTAVSMVPEQEVAKQASKKLLEQVGFALKQGI